MKKKLLSSILAAAMVVSMAACGASSTDSGNASAGGSQAANSADATGDELEPVTLKMYFHVSNVTDDTAVMEAENAYLKSPEK